MNFSVIFILVSIAFHNAVCDMLKEGNPDSFTSTESGLIDSAVLAKPEMNVKEKITTTENYIIRSRTTESIANSVETKATTLPAAVTESSDPTTLETTQNEEESSIYQDCLYLEDDKVLFKILNNFDELSWYMENCYPFRIGDLLPDLI